MIVQWEEKDIRGRKVQHPKLNFKHRITWRATANGNVWGLYDPCDGMVIEFPGEKFGLVEYLNKEGFMPPEVLRRKRSRHVAR